MNFFEDSCWEAMRETIDKKEGTHCKLSVSKERQNKVGIAELRRIMTIEKHKKLNEEEGRASK